MLTVLTLNHRHTPLANRARYHLTDAGQMRLYRLVRRTCHGQLVYLATCNRVEISTWIQSESRGQALSLIRSVGQWFFPELGSDYLNQATTLFGEAAASHLMRVAAGLESQVTGDIQVLGQVRTAYQAAVRAKTVGAELNRLFQTALHAAKRVHREGGIQLATVGQVAAEELLRRVGPGRFAVVGAGETGTAAAETLVRAGARVTIVNRTRDRALRLAGRLNTEVGEFESRHAVVAGSDGAIVATGATSHVLKAWELAPHRAGSSRPVEIVDLSVPSGCDPEIGGVPGVRLTTLDDFPAQSSDSVSLAKDIIAEEVARYREWLARRSREQARVA